MNKPITICIDVGHARKQNRSTVIPEYYESVQMWQLGEFLIEELQKYPDFKVTRTRTDLNTDLEVSARGRKSQGSDLLLSLHSNAAVPTRTSSDTDVSFLKKQVAAEAVDRVSGIYLVPRGTETDKASATIAQLLAKKVAKVMETKDPPKWYSRLSAADRDRDGVLNDNYYGLLHGAWTVNTPAVILEHSFHTNTRASLWLMDENNLKSLAVAEAAALAEHFGVSQAMVMKGDVNGDGKISSADYIMAKRIMLNTYKPTPLQLWAADIDGDGKVSPSDYIKIKRDVIGSYSIGLIFEYIGLILSGKG